MDDEASEGRRATPNRTALNKRGYSSKRGYSGRHGIRAGDCAGVAAGVFRSRFAVGGELQGEMGICAAESGTSGFGGAGGGVAVSGGDSFVVEADARRRTALNKRGYSSNGGHNGNGVSMRRCERRSSIVRR